MIIGIDLSWVSPQNQAGGVFQYAMRLLTALVRYSGYQIVAIVSEINKSTFDHISCENNFKLAVKDPGSSFVSILEKEHIDIIHTPIQHHVNFTLSVPMITTLHDLQHYYFPEFFSDDEIAFRNLHYKKSAEFSERVIVSYHHVKQDIIKFYGIPSDKIDVCGHGLTEPDPVNTDFIESVRNKYRLPHSYLLYTANTWKHKNHIRLVRALKILKENYGLQPLLVCTGYQYPDYFPEIEAEIKLNDLVEQVRFLGYLPEEEMPAILCGATLSVIPTLYEAGSFPLMEAMNYGVPVICSATTSLPDTIGDSRFVFDPNSPEDIAQKIARMLNDAEIRRENIANSAARVSAWRWDKAVLPYIECYLKAIDSFKTKKRNVWYHTWALNYELMSLKLESKLRKEITNCTKKLENCNKSIDSIVSMYERELNAIKSSISWKITYPFRKLIDFFLSFCNFNLKK